MEIKGRMLTKEEVARVGAPYHKNSGKQWSLAQMAQDVTNGDRAIQADPARDHNLNEVIRCAVEE